MDVLSQIGLTVLGAVVGAIFSFMLPVVLNNRRYKKRPDLLGMWKSTYRPDFRENTTGITEEVKIDLHFGKLRMRNSSNPSEDAYLVLAELVQRTYITGHWLSLKPGANAFGAIILTVSPLGDLMYGYLTGLGNTGERTYCGWVLARRKEDLDIGIGILRRTSLNIVRQKDTVEHRGVSERVAEAK